MKTLNRYFAHLNGIQITQSEIPLNIAQDTSDTADIFKDHYNATKE